MCPEKAFQSFTFVKLHRPLPVIITLRAGRGIFSSTVTWAALPASTRARAAWYAAISPDAPAPITTISDFIYRSLNQTSILPGPRWSQA